MIKKVSGFTLILYQLRKYNTCTKVTSIHRPFFKKTVKIQKSVKIFPKYFQQLMQF